MASEFFLIGEGGRIRRIYNEGGVFMTYAAEKADIVPAAKEVRNSLDRPTLLAGGYHGPVSYMQSDRLYNVLTRKLNVIFKEIDPAKDVEAQIKIHLAEIAERHRSQSENFDLYMQRRDLKLGA